MDHGTSFQLSRAILSELAPMRLSDLGRMRRGGEFQEDAILLEDEAPFPGEFIVGFAERVILEPFAIGFVCGEAVYVVDAVSDVRGTLMRGEIADHVGAAAGDRLSPIARVFLEIRFGVGVDLVADEAGDGHRSSSVMRQTLRSAS